MIFEGALALLARSVPDWFTVDVPAAAELVGRAQPPATAWQMVGVDLRIIREGRAIAVQELVPGARFPARCPERHIQPDGTFCLGLHRTPVTSRPEAIKWWDHLYQYLLCQSTAEETGLWPLAHALDHGDAGQHHGRALEIAAELGDEAAYAAAYNDEPSWITDRGLKLLDKQDRPINGRLPCPRGCRHGRGRGRAVLRRACPRRSLVLELVQRERLRRSALQHYWREAEAAGEICCGRMRVCGLRKPPTSLDLGSAPEYVRTRRSR